MNLLHYLRLLRPTQWLKNLILLFPPFLGGSLFKRGVLEDGAVPVIAFCFASSSIYILNDLLDAGNDANHPTKRFRPIPSGRVRKVNAALMSTLLLVSSIILALQREEMFLVFLLLYVMISSMYSYKLKEIALVDLFCISAGFLLRLQAGGVSFGIQISDWLFLSVFLLSLFLSTGKRLCEKNTLGANAGSHRKCLLLYPPGFLEGTMYLTGATVLVTYTMYVIQRPSLVYTVPLCTFGLLRYILRVKSGMGGDPTDSLLKDFPLFAVGVLWAVMVGWATYGK